MAIEVMNTGFVCTRCGRAYVRRQQSYPVCYASNYKGSGYLNICRECFKDIYNTYFRECNDIKLAIRQVCRKLDIYWNEQIGDSVVKKAAERNAMQYYLARINTDRYAGRCYDDTLREEDRLWEFSKPLIVVKEVASEEAAPPEVKEDHVEIPLKVMRYWGEGYDPKDYLILEERLKEMLEKLHLKREDLDIGTDKVIKQICATELDIEKARLAGKSVDKLQNTLNTFLGSANIKPSQQKADEPDSVSGKPLGVLARIYEEKRPIPEADPALKDTDGLLRYITTWYLGHAAKMMKKNSVHVPLYEKAMEKFRVRHPNLQGDTDDDDLDEAILDAELGEDV